MGGCTEDIQVRSWSLSHLTPFSCPRQPAARNVHSVTGRLPSLLPGDFLTLAGEQGLTEKEEFSAAAARSDGR